MAGDKHLQTTRGRATSALKSWKSQTVLQWTRLVSRLKLWAQIYPWFGWAFVYTFVVFTFFLYRCSSLGSLFEIYASPSDSTIGMALGSLALGLLQDFVCATYFASTLWLFDTFSILLVGQYCSDNSSGVVGWFTGSLVMFTVSWLLFVAVMAPFVADVVTVQLRGMRFTFAMVTMAIEEKDHAEAMAVSESQVTVATWNVAALVAFATFFAVMRTRNEWANLAAWNPTRILLSSSALNSRNQVEDSDDERPDAGGDPSEMLLSHSRDERSNVVRSKKSQYVAVSITDCVDMKTVKTIEFDDNMVVVRHPLTTNNNLLWKQILVALLGLVTVSLIVVAVTGASSAVIAFLALNPTLDELLGHSLQPTADEASITAEDMKHHWNETFIDKAEDFSLYWDNTLYRRTTGFHGDLEFDIEVSDKDPPNVLLIVVESFRYHDSHYLVGEEDPSNLFKGSNITITPNFDKWAKRGIGLRNHWSSWRTSRSLESLLFGQLPYDSVTKSGTTGGQRSTELSGLPQLFTAKGYETFFTSGCLIDYDNWDAFLPAHGFDTVWGRNEMMFLAEKGLGIRHEDWSAPEHRSLYWGVHDDLSFQLLGDLMVNKTKDQRNRTTHGEAKKPLFLNHYTISSHVDYRERPRWYAEADKPDFSAVYKGEKYADNVKNYLEMRYFTDMELGKFMDRMASEGILNDTIVIISGDHGQGPEFGNDVPEARDVSATRVAGAIIAEGRLGNAAGMVIDDATEQYDMLNTVLDIVGVPEGGFDQHGLGRSLKRKIKFGERAVYSNNPTRKMSVVRGHERLRYDRVTYARMLHNVDTDHDMHTDLLPSLSADEQADWLRRRDIGRLVDNYYVERWDGECLLATKC